MKKSKKELVNIKEFMANWLQTPYQDRGYSKKMQEKIAQMERWKKQLAVKEEAGIPFTADDVIMQKKIQKLEYKLKKRKHVLTHKGMHGFLIEHGDPLPRKASFREAKRQDYAGQRIVYVQDETKGHRVVPYYIPQAVQVLPKKTKEEGTPLLERRISSLLSEYQKARRQNDFAYAQMIRETLVDNQIQYCETFGNIFKKAESFLKEDEFIMDKPNRREQKNKIYQYRRK